MKLIVKDQEIQSEIDKLKAEFDDKYKDLMNDYRVLQAVKSERDKAQSIIEALNNEIEEKLSKINNKLNNSSNLELDDYLALKQDEVKIKGKIDYFIAANEERDSYISQIDESLFEQRENVRFIRIKILKLLGNTRLEEFIESSTKELSIIRSAMYHDWTLDTDRAMNGVRLNVYDAVDKFILDRIDGKIKSLEEVNTKELSIENIEIKTTRKTPGERHLERIEKEKSVNKPTGFKRLLDNIKTIK